MLKIKKTNNEDCIKLNNKFFSINITNVCNLSCGGCNQLCGLYPKEKNWYITMDQLKESIGALRSYVSSNWGREDYSEANKFCGLYGGEPTLHPEFEKILEVLYANEDLPFCIYTNGRTFKKEIELVDLTLRTGREISRQTMQIEMERTSHFSVLHQFHTHKKNVAYRIDFKTKDSSRPFVPCLCAPCDWQDPSMTKKDYVKQAKKVCYQWNNCESSIYNGKAYACHLAASMDHMYHEGKNGWKIETGKNPFHRTQEEIDNQLENFCYRCGYNLKDGMGGFEKKTNINQYAHKKTLVTKTNESNCLQSSKIQKLPIIQS
jgi:organic radical activating enzyme